ncbi:hypothetical protein [Piscirickettsia litoralis]|uniref:hypothetical protein n=1 Tax=Piscirickettsia litoralis TaxID=1891921 RepID=UPI001112E4A5|nr:hypothetical protein [Piscirickettsia litoralis]
MGSITKESIQTFKDESKATPWWKTALKVVAAAVAIVCGAALIASSCGLAVPVIGVAAATVIPAPVVGVAGGLYSYGGTKLLKHAFFECEVEKTGKRLIKAAVESQAVL